MDASDASAIVAGTAGKEVFDRLKKQAAGNEAAALQFSSNVSIWGAATGFGAGVEHATAMAELVAELAKHEGTRPALGKVVVTEVANLLAASSSPEGWAPATIVQSLRAVANLCFDNDENRAAVAAAGVVSTVAALLAELKLRLAAAAAVRVMEADTAEGLETIRTTLAGAVMNMCLDNEEVQKLAADSGIPAHLGWMYSTTSLDDFRGITLAKMALAVFSKNDAALAALCEHGGVERLVGILKEAAAEAGDGGDDGAEEEEEEVLETERALLRELIHSDASLPSLANPRVIQMLLDIVGCQEQNEKLAGVGCNLLAVAISNPGCFDVLCSLEGSKEEVVNRFVSWMDRAATHPKGNWDIPSAGAIGLGNIARSPEAALWIADVPGVVGKLCMLMKTDNTAFEYSALGTVKNLSIANENKPKLLTAEVMEALHTTMKSPQAPVQYLASSALRSICIEQPSDLIQTLVADRDGLLERLVHLSEQEEQHVHSEALRALCNVVRYGQSPPPAVVLKALPGFVKMTKSEHLMLVSDAVVTLVRLCAVGKEKVFAAGALKAATSLMKAALGMPDDDDDSCVDAGGAPGAGGADSAAAAATSAVGDEGSGGKSVETAAAAALDAVAAQAKPRVVEPGIVCNAASLAISMLDSAGVKSSAAAEAKAAIVGLTLLPVDVISKHATKICQQLGMVA